MRSVAIAAVAAVTLLGVTLVGVASGGAAATKQRVAIDGKWNHSTGTGTFKLVALSGGALKGESGKFTGGGQGPRSVVRKNGQEVRFIKAVDTYTGANGTLTVSQRIEIVSAGRGYAINTGTWRVVSGTGAYKGYGGGGTFAAAAPPPGTALFFREEGYLTKP
jgi:hypothetical protein